MIGSIHSSETSSQLLFLELSRNLKENHGTRIIKLCKPISNSFSNLIASLSATQVCIYDTNSLGQGHIDLISHYHARDEDIFVDACWLANESDGYLAVLLESGDIELLSLSYSSIISIINIPSSIKISKIFADPTDGERLFGIDNTSDTLHIFSFDAAVDSPLVDSQVLEKSSLFESCGHLLEVTSDGLKMRPLINSSDDNFEPLLEISESGRIKFASIRTRNTNNNNTSSLDYFIIDHQGRIFFLHADPLKITSSLWNKRAKVIHDGDNLLLILCTDGNLALFDLDKNDFTVFKGALKNSSKASETVCLFIEAAECCSEGKVRRVLIGDDLGMLSIYRIVK